MHKQKLIDDTFQVTEIDKGGKVFDKGKYIRLGFQLANVIIFLYSFSNFWQD